MYKREWESYNEDTNIIAISKLTPEHRKIQEEEKNAETTNKEKETKEVMMQKITKNPEELKEVI